MPYIVYPGSQIFWYTYLKVIFKMLKIVCYNFRFLGSMICPHKLELVLTSRSYCRVIDSEVLPYIAWLRNKWHWSRPVRGTAHRGWTCRRRCARTSHSAGTASGWCAGTPGRQSDMKLSRSERQRTEVECQSLTALGIRESLLVQEEYPY